MENYKLQLQQDWAEPSTALSTRLSRGRWNCENEKMVDGNNDVVRNLWKRETSGEDAAEMT